MALEQSTFQAARLAPKDGRAGETMAASFTTRLITRAGKPPCRGRQRTVPCTIRGKSVVRWKALKRGTHDKPISLQARMRARGTPRHRHGTRHHVERAQRVPRTGP